MKIEITGEADIDRAARQFLDAAGTARHIAFYAQMGAGKTTFTAALCRALGVTDDVNSPTFSIINEYRDREGRKHKLTAEGFFARAVCHELDHLDGILYTDIASEVYDLPDEEG